MFLFFIDLTIAFVLLRPLGGWHSTAAELSSISDHFCGSDILLISQQLHPDQMVALVRGNNHNYGRPAGQLTNSHQMII